MKYLISNNAKNTFFNKTKIGCKNLKPDWKIFQKKDLRSSETATRREVVEERS